jgi:hypothetical protein
MKIESSKKLSIGTNKGSAIVIVLTLLAVMTTLLITNSVCLSQLRKELTLIEKQQKQRIAQK